MLPLLMPAVSLATLATGAYDMGPTFGEDRVGGDYAHLPMHSPPSRAPNHWVESAEACAQHCAEDVKCCEYTYIPPYGNSGGDTCILKAPVSAPSRRQPPSGDLSHWTGLATRAVTDATNSTLSAQCRGRPAPAPAPHPAPGLTPCAWPSSCKGLWDNVHCVCNPTWAFPGPSWLHPKIHNSPDCLHNPGWHDMAGAITYDGVQHIFQGCPDGPGSDSWNNHPANHDTAGWHHATSTDYVHFKNLGIPPGLSAIKETYKGMDSDETPCSGFVTIDPEKHVACAGFRQCHGNGVKGKSKDGVPLELRCTPIGDSSLQNWSAPEFIDAINPSWPHHEPYDPVRPWVDADGLWYVALSLDACDNTQPICAAGGSLLMYRSPALRGAKANWTRHGALFTTNTTKSGANTTVGGVNNVFVTSDYIGGLRGDPAGGRTRCVLQNTGGATYWCGTQRNGNALQPHWDKVGAVGKYDYGACTMARTVGPNANQVLPAESRIVLMGWTGSPEDGIGAASQSLSRDLTMSSDYELLQQFVPELQMLRLPGSKRQLTLGEHAQAAGALRLEIVAKFSWSAGTGLPTNRFGFSFLGGAGNISVDCTNSTATGEAPGGCMVGIVGSTNNTATTVTWMPVLPIASNEVRIHTIVDHSIIETIVNNRTAMITNSINMKSAHDTAVSLFGYAGVHGHLTTYELKAANNLNASASHAQRHKSDDDGNAQWQKIYSGWETTGQIVNDTRSDSVIRFPSAHCSPAAACNLVGIQTGPISSSSSLMAQIDADGTAMEIAFTVEDQTVGAKARVEATACYVTAADLRRDGMDPAGKESQQLQALRFVYQNCSGAAAASDASRATWQSISYSLMLPSDFPPDSQAIMGQFHGRPDPRIFLSPQNETRRLSTAEAYAACLDPEKRHGNCNEGQVSGGAYDGWRYKQGGYPPLTFGYSSNKGRYFYAYGRSDDRVFVPKADCSFNPGEDYWPDGKVCPGGKHELVHGIWRAPFSALPLGRWLKFDWQVRWSAYATEGGSTLSDGVVALKISDGDKMYADVDWKGPLGRHDDGRAPFFKLGVYDPSGSTAKLEIQYKDFAQSFGVL